MNAKEKFNLISVVMFCIIAVAGGIVMIDVGAYVSGVFIGLIGLLLFAYVFIQMIIPMIKSDAKITDPVAESNNKIITEYFTYCVFYFFHESQKEDLRKGFLVGYGRGLLADDLDSVDLEFDKKAGLHAGNSNEYEAGFNLGYIYAMDGVRPLFRIVMLQNAGRVELMDNCDCNRRDPINDDHLGQTHGHDGYMCLNCGGFYID